MIPSSSPATIRSTIASSTARLRFDPETSSSGSNISTVAPTATAFAAIAFV